MTSVEEFSPDWVSPPGDTISDILEEKEISVDEFARLMGHKPEEVNDLLQGRSSITIGVARQLGEILGASVEFWMSRDFQYRQDISRLHEGEQDWLRELPVGDMAKFGWLHPVPRPSEELAACLDFFGVPNVAAWDLAYKDLQELAVFRTSHSFDSRSAAVAAWLRQGEIQSDSTDCNQWNPIQFRESLSNIRALTRQKDPTRFVSKLQKLCAESGVAVVIVRSPNGCRASGAIRFGSPDKAILQLSFRYLTDDHFWFTFFHEAAHLLLHDGGRWLIEGIDTVPTREEAEADDFAQSTLIPPESQSEMLALPPNAREVVRFATRIGVSPGIVVGQLQHFEMIGHDQLNSLKRRFTWAH